MSRWSTNFNNHAFHSQWKTFLESLNQKSSELLTKLLNRFIDTMPAHELVNKTLDGAKQLKSNITQ